MRPTALLSALAAGLMLAGAAHAAPPPQPTQAQAASADAAVGVDDLPPMAEDQREADAMAAQLAAIDDRISADEARMTTLRDTDLAQENARIRAIKPALPFHRTSPLPSWL
ncbi:MAG TPA: hypothetical protein VHX64_04200 [Caulobacteraceae bacterium]|jgi:hypothetical protein|nr:hypothetical protein [Caulobacteraceae bacterium]